MRQTPEKRRLKARAVQGRQPQGRVHSETQLDPADDSSSAAESEPSTASSPSQDDADSTSGSEKSTDSDTASTTESESESENAASRAYNSLLNWFMQWTVAWRQVELEPTRDGTQSDRLGTGVVVLLNVLLVAAKILSVRPAPAAEISRDSSSAGARLFDDDDPGREMLLARAMEGPDWASVDAAAATWQILRGLMFHAEACLALCVFVSVSGAVVLFSQKRRYQLFYSSPATPLNQGRFARSSAELVPTHGPETNADAARPAVAWPLWLLRVFGQPLVALFDGAQAASAWFWRKRRRGRHSSGQAGDRAVPVYYWRVSMWQPSPRALKLFVWFSPPHVLAVALAPAHWLAALCVHAALMASALALLTRQFEQKLLDERLLFEQTLLEYNERFVHTQQPVRYAASALASSPLFSSASASRRRRHQRQLYPPAGPGVRPAGPGTPSDASVYAMASPSSSTYAGTPPYQAYQLRHTSSVHPRPGLRP